MTHEIHRESQGAEDEWDANKWAEDAGSTFPAPSEALLLSLYGRLSDIGS